MARPQLPLDDLRLRDLHVDQGLGVRAVATQVGTSPATVRRRLRALGVLRTHDEAVDLHRMTLLDGARGCLWPVCEQDAGFDQAGRPVGVCGYHWKVAAGLTRPA